MLNHRLTTVGVLLGLGTLLVAGTTGWTQAPTPADLAQAQPASPNQEGVEVLARGPIHEAFAEPVSSQPQATPIIPKPPPDPLPEVPPDEKPQGEAVQWIPGYWNWDDDRNDFIWVSGFWRAPPPGRQWMPGHWIQVQGGFQWVPGFWAGQDVQEVQFLAPPPEPVEAGPSVPAPAADSVYVAGTWVYRDARYLWRPGYWVSYRPGWVWIPAHYVWTPVGYVFVDGYWDFELRRRGLLFAPVYVDRRVWIRPGFYYQPRYVVADDFLLGALFVRPRFAHYYFGDYFEPIYARRGFTAWVDFRVGRFGFDPLFSYYRWHNRNDRRWEGDLRGLYVARFNGQAPRPPRTLVQQNTLIQNITVNKTVQVTNVKNVTVLAPLNQVDRSVVRLEPVSRERRLEAQKTAEHVREVSQQRNRVETQLVATGTPPVRPTDPPRTVKLNLPKSPLVNRTNESVQPPPHPVPTTTIAKPVPPRTETKPPPPPPPNKNEGKPPTPANKNEAKPPTPHLEVHPPAPMRTEPARPPVPPASVERKVEPPPHHPEVRSVAPPARPEASRPVGPPRPEVGPPKPPAGPHPESGHPPTGTKPKPDEKPK
jgi:hypothetical protein